MCTVASKNWLWLLKIHQNTSLGIQIFNAFLLSDTLLLFDKIKPLNTTIVLAIILSISISRRRVITLKLAVYYALRINEKPTFC